MQVFRPRTAPESIDLVAKLLEYTPEARLSAVEAMCHPFFDELRVEGARMPNGKDFPLLFNFTREGTFCVICARSKTTKADVRAAMRPLNRAFRTPGSHPHARTAALRARPGFALNSPGQLRADTIGADEDSPGLNARRRSMVQASSMREKPVSSCFYLTIFCCCSTPWLDVYLFSLSFFLPLLILVLRLMLRVALGPPHCRDYVLNRNHPFSPYVGLYTCQ